MISAANEQQLSYWLTLASLPKLGPAPLFELYKRYPDIAEFFHQSDNELKSLGLAEETIIAINAHKDNRYNQVFKWLQADQHHIIHLASPDYPTMLKQTGAPPPILYIKGNLQCLQQPQLAIVGSRNASPAGLETASQFASNLSKAGLVITSGMALGIDGAAHRGALAANGQTIAVIGTGQHMIYPSQHKALAADIIANGAIVSEFPLDTTPKSGNFPQRNHNIAGLSLGTLVVEAALQSGSLITARLAGEQGREVFAIPGSIHNPRAKGCLQLLRQGAKLVETVQDILEELSPLYRTQCQINDHQDQKIPNKKLDPLHRKLLECIGDEPTAVDIIIARAGLATSEVLVGLVTLELLGELVSVAGGYCKR